MSTRDQVEWDDEKMHGFVDMGSNVYNENDNLIHAKNALVFMAVGINGHWKMPLGYFLFEGLNGSDRENLLNKCLQLMVDTGTKIHLITFDGVYSNAIMCKYFQDSFNINNNDNNDVCFNNPFTNKPVYIFYNACHMLKLITLITLGDFKYI